MITAMDVIKSTEFQKIAVIDALELIAKTNGRTIEEAALAFTSGAPNVVNQVNKLVSEAAAYLANDLNNGTDRSANA